METLSLTDMEAPQQSTTCCYLCDSPVQTHPVPSEHGGELRTGVIQSGNELVLTKGTNLRRSLSKHQVVILWLLEIRCDDGPYLPGCDWSLQRHQARHVPLLSDKTEGLLTVSPAESPASAPIPHQRNDEALRQLKQVSPQDGALSLWRPFPLDSLQKTSTKLLVLKPSGNMDVCSPSKASW